MGLEEKLCGRKGLFRALQERFPGKNFSLPRHYLEMVARRKPLGEDVIPIASDMGHFSKLALHDYSGDIVLCKEVDNPGQLSILRGLQSLLKNNEQMHAFVVPALTESFLREIRETDKYPEIEEELEMYQLIVDRSNLREDLAASIARSSSRKHREISNSMPLPTNGSASVVGGRFQLLDFIGGGAMGQVYRARQENMERNVAIKLMKTEDPSDVEIQRFMREARSAGRLDHPNIIKVYDVGIDVDDFGRSSYYIAMQYVDGESLQQKIDKRELTPHESARIIRDIARALDHAHGKGIIHRDIKPANIILARIGIPYLADLGLVKDLSSTAAVTREDDIIGSPAYMSPEMVKKGALRTDKRTDIFSLGATLYHMITGIYPFSGESYYSLIENITTKEPIRPSELVQGVHPALDLVCAKAMEKDPKDRYQSVKEMAKDLDDYLKTADNPIPALQEVAGEAVQMAHMRRRYKRIAALIIAGALATCAATGAIAYHFGKHVNATNERR